MGAKRQHAASRIAGVEPPSTIFGGPLAQPQRQHRLRLSAVRSGRLGQTGRVSVAFDLAAAQAAKRLVQLSHDSWTAGLRELAGTDITGMQWHDAALRQYGHAAAVLVWARGLDDMCRADAGQLPAYGAARPQVEALIGAARYACNRAVHQLITLNQPVGGFSYPKRYPFGFTNLAYFQWVAEAFLPDPRTENAGQARFRAHYIAEFAGKDVKEGLDRLRSWFDTYV